MKYTECLGNDISAGGRNDDVLISLLFGFGGYLAQHRYRERLLYVRFATELCVEEADAEHDGCWQCQSEHQAHQPIHRDVGGHSHKVGTLHHFGIGHCDGLRQGVFFTLAEQIQIEFLLDFLLTRHLCHCLGLRRHIGNLALGARFLVARRLQFDVKRVEVVVYRCNDGHSRGFEFAFGGAQVGVVGSCGVEQFLIVQQLLVVVRNHALHTAVVDTHIGRKQVILVVGVNHISAYLLRQVELGLNRERRLGVLCTLGEEHAAGILEVGYSSTFVKVGHLIIHIT